MNRRNFLTKSALGAALAISPSAVRLLAEDQPKTADKKGVVVSTNKIVAPEKGNIRIAVPVSAGATVIDFAGPWDVFTSVMIMERGPSMEDQMPFELLMVSDSLEPVTVEGGMKVVPHHTFATLPECRIAVVGAQQGSPQLQEWLKTVTPKMDVTMSVCVGVNHLAKAGLLAGKSATTHHDFYDRFTKEHPEIDVKRGVRFVENEKYSTSGGEMCGVDLALRVVERYFGRAVAEKTARYVEYPGKGWMV